MAATKKKKAEPAEQLSLEDEGFATTADAPEVLIPPLHVVEEPKPKPKPGDPDFDWQEEYPGEEVWVYTVPQDARKTPAGKQSPPGLTIGLAKLNEDRAPNPGEMHDAFNLGGLAPMWLFIENVSSPASLKVQKLLRVTEYNQMLRGWALWSGIELSE